MKKWISFLVAFLISLSMQGQAYAKNWTIVNDRFSCTAGETLATGDVAMLSTDGTCYKADADLATRRPAIGIVGKGAATASSAEIIPNGTIEGMSGLTVGANVFLSATAGAVTSTPVEAYPQPIGLALTATKIKVGIYAHPQLSASAYSNR